LAPLSLGRIFDCQSSCFLCVKMLWILLGILALLISAFYYKVVICGDKVDVPAAKKKSSEDKSQRGQRNVKSPKVKSPKVKSPKVASQVPDAETCASPTKSERLQSQIKQDKPTTPALIDDQTSEGPTKDVLTAKEPSQILDLTPEIAPPQVQNKTAVEPTQTEVIQGHINPEGPTLPAPVDVQSGEDPTKDVATAVDPTPSDVKQSRINNDLTAPDVQSAETSTARDPTALEIKQVSELQESASKQNVPDSLIPLDSSQMSAVSEVTQPAKETPSESKDVSQSGQASNEPEIKKDQPSGTDGKEKKKKKKHKKKKHSKKDGEKSEEGGEKKKRKRYKKKSKSKDEGAKSKEDNADPGATK